MSIKVGVGGWTFEPWRGVFFPEKLPKARELEYASRQLTSIEINGTFYRTQKPDTFRKWAAEVPDDFMFSVKGPRYIVEKKQLSDAREQVDWFFASGLEELGDKLGPLLWQFSPRRAFDPPEFAAFLAMLPKEVKGRRLRHALEPRHDSFRVPAFVDLAREHGAGIVVAESDDYPQVADLTGDFVYARLQRSAEDVETGYDAAALDRWADIARAWERGEAPDGLAYVGERSAGPARDVFVYFISGAKVRNPAAASALIERLGGR